MSGYPLAVVLALREREEALAQAAVARALSEEIRRGTLRDVVAARAAAQRARLHHARATPVQAGAPAAELRERAAFQDRLRADAGALGAELGEAEAALADARAGSERCRAALARAHAAVRALERHREAWQAAARLRRDRRAEAAAEDVTAGRAAR